MLEYQLIMTIRCWEADAVYREIARESGHEIEVLTKTNWCCTTALILETQLNRRMRVAGNTEMALGE